MSFINEFISDADFQKYHLKNVDDRILVGRMRSDNWTIDRERDIYLRQVYRGKEDFTHITKWTFLWDGYVLFFEVHYLESKNFLVGGNGIMYLFFQLVI